MEDASNIEKYERNAPGFSSAKRFWLWIGGITTISLLLLFIFYFIPRIKIKREVAEYKVDMVENMQSSIAQSQAMGVQTRDIDRMEMVYVPEGAFLMGSNSGADDEKPEHIVFLDAFWIDRYEVTNAQFAAFLNAQGNQSEGGVIWLDANDEDACITQSGGEWVPDSDYDDHPVVEESWYGAQAYCEWVGGRLPTEAEWEKAARGVDGRRYPWGEESPTCSLAQFSGCLGETVPVGSFPNGASPYGALDMAGNVWEWVADWYDENYYINSSISNPKGGLKGGSYRIHRGGSWYFKERNLRASNRYWLYPVITSYNLGFRCVRSP